MVKSSSRPRRTNTGTSRSITPAKAPHFFKIITSSAVKHSKLMIPRKFVSKYGKNLPDLVRLKVPSGAVWQVELAKSSGDIWLCNGWKEFTEYYSVNFGHFLVFRYDENSHFHFHVLIFDTSASEIEYPSGSTQGGQSSMDKANNSVEVSEDLPFHQARKKISERDENDNDNDNNDVSIETLEGSVEMVNGEEVAAVEILDNPPTCRSVPASDVSSHKTKSASHLQPLLENFHPSGIETRASKLGNLNGDVKPNCPRREIKKECGGGTPIAPRQLRSQVPHGRQLASTSAAAHKFRVLQRAKAFKSKNPFFTVCMKPSHVCHRYTLNIPVGFAGKYLSAENSIVKLRISDEKVWPVNCYYYRTLNVVRTLYWGTFAQDNNLKIDDVCVFEMIQSVELLFNVIIFRAA